jgi:hypothetical protein
LPKQHELSETLPDFLNKFPGAQVFNIISHDCKKSIPIINKDGFVVLPHYLHSEYTNILEVANHCHHYLTLLRYFDLKEVVEFITFVIINNYGNPKTQIDRHFETLNDMNMTTIKMYYIHLLQNIQSDNWKTIYEHFIRIRKPRIIENNTIDPKGNKIKTIDASSIKGTSGVYVTTKDAYTLTDGPTIFISNDIEKIAKFCIQQANIPVSVMESLMKKIEYNNIINAKLYDLNCELETIKEISDKKVKNAVSGFGAGTKVSSRSKSNKDSKKMSKDIPDEFENKGDLTRLTQEMSALRTMIKSAVLNDTFIPNKKMHLDKWADNIDCINSFTSNIDEQIISDIMAIKGVENTWKVLLMMGIGVFINHDSIVYTEIMKKLADEQKLYMIIASSDYIYGTNYQFCHGFLSKDLNLTQEKIIQAMGRIGRNNIQQNYTLRFREDEQILKLFTSETDKPEIINMNILFNSHKVIWRDNQYIEIEDDLIEDELDIMG